MQKLFFVFLLLPLLLPSAAFSQTVHTSVDTCFNADFSIAYYLETTVESEAGRNTVTFTFTEGTAALSEVSALQIYRDVDARYSDRERIATGVPLPANGTFVFVDEHETWTADAGATYGYTGSGTLPASTPLFYSVVVNTTSGTARPRRSTPAIFLPDLPTDVITDMINPDMTLITQVYPNSEDSTVILQLDFGPNYDYFQEVLASATPGQPIYPAGDRPIFFGRVYLNNMADPNGRTDIQYGNIYWGHEGSAFAKFKVAPEFLDANNDTYAWFTSGRPGHSTTVPVPINFDFVEDDGPGPIIPTGENGTVFTSFDTCYNDDFSIAYYLETTVIAEPGKNSVVFSFTEGTSTIGDVTALQIYRDVDARYRDRERIATNVPLHSSGNFVFIDEHATWTQDGGGDYDYTGSGTLPSETPLFYSVTVNTTSGVARPRRSTPGIYLPEPPTDVVTDVINSDMTLITQVYPNSADTTVILQLDFGPNYDYLQEVLATATPGEPLYPAGDRPVFFGRVYLNNMADPNGRTDIQYGNIYWGHEGSAFAKFKVAPEFLDANGDTYAWFTSGRPGHSTTVPVPINFDLVEDDGPGPEIPTGENGTVFMSFDTCYNDDFSIAYYLETTVIAEPGKNSVVFSFTEGTSTIGEVTGLQIYRDVDARYRDRVRIATNVPLHSSGNFVFIDEHATWTQDGGGDYGYTGSGTLPDETPLFYSVVVNTSSGNARPRRSTPGIYLPDPPTDVVTDVINPDMTLITQVYPNSEDTTVILQLDFGPNYDYFQQVLADATPGEPLYPAGDRPVFFGRVYLNNVADPNGRTDIQYGNIYWGHEGSAFAKFKVDLEHLNVNGDTYAWFNSGRPGVASATPVPINFDFIIESLPIELRSFEATQDGKNVQLNWQTDREENTDDYLLERSTDNGQTFYPIGTVSAENNLAGAAYRYLDEEAANLNTQQLYYRLHARDFDGSSQSFGVVTVTLPVNGLRVFPNPVASGNTINVLGAAAGARVELFGMDGRFILNLPAANEARTDFSLPELVPGLYLLRATSLAGERKTTKIIVR